MITPYTLPCEALSSKDLARVGGKGANLGALTAAGIPVPPGFCVTTAAYDVFLAALPDQDAWFARLDGLDGKDLEAARQVAEGMRAAMGALPLPPEIAEPVVAAWRALGATHPVAVRSSATAEDLPGASFAGQQDTYLNIVGEEALLDAVRRCWISLYTDRAVLYRARSGFGHRAVRLSVVVQRLVDPDVSGILFTADPVSGHRGIVSIDAGFGLGEALVGGLINADLYKVHTATRQIVLVQPGDKRIAIRSVPGGGTREEPLPEAQRTARSLTDAQVLQLADVGRQVERHYGGVPQDIEWCLKDGQIFVVQARPITHLYPLPDAPPDDGSMRIYLSFGHVQMMTEAMPRLAREAWATFIPVNKRAGVPTRNDLAELSDVMVSVGSRLYLDVTGAMRVPRVRRGLLGVLGHVYADVAKGVEQLTQRPEFQTGRGAPRAVMGQFWKIIGPVLRRVPGVLFWRDPAQSHVGWERTAREVPAAARARIAAAPPEARLKVAQREVSAMFPEVRGVLPAIPGGLLAHHLLTRLARGSWADGVRDAVDSLLRGLPHNVTTEMDLRVGDLTDRVRPYPALAELLRTRPWSEARSLALQVAGGAAFVADMDAFLAAYGMRGAGEIDVSRPRWQDDPALLLRVIIGGLSAGEAGVHRKRHAAQVAEGDAAVGRLVAAAPWHLRPLVRRLCRVVRGNAGLREHPKYTMVQLFALVRAEALATGAALVARGQLDRADQVWHFGFDEIADALAQPARDLRPEALARQEVYARDAARKPPFVFSNEGEVPTLTVDRKDLPPGALPGTPASAGVVEGRVRVVRDPSEETLQSGEILVAPYTDPGWTPLFIHAAGVVTEVGGLMTHGAVVAREYGIPAVVSVAGATERLKTGQRVRLDGTAGYVVVLEDV